MYNLYYSGKCLAGILAHVTALHESTYYNPKVGQLTSHDTQVS